jgi:hypothetical protein
MAAFFPGQQHHGAPTFGVGGDGAQALQAARGAGSGEGTAGPGEEGDEEGDVNAVLAGLWGMEPGRGNSPTGERQGTVFLALHASFRGTNVTWMCT